jgi:hypothetical protein
MFRIRGFIFRKKNHFPEDEPSGSKYVENIINYSTNLEKLPFVDLYWTMS